MLGKSGGRMFIGGQAKEVDQIPLQKSHPAKMLGLLVAGKLQKMLHTRDGSSVVCRSSTHKTHKGIQSHQCSCPLDFVGLVRDSCLFSGLAGTPFLQPGHRADIAKSSQCKKGRISNINYLQVLSDFGSNPSRPILAVIPNFSLHSAHR